MNNRRKFLGFLGLGLTGLIGRRVIGNDNVEEVLTEVPLPPSVEKVKRWVTESPITIRPKRDDKQILWTTAKFDSPITVNNGDSLNITYTISVPKLLCITHAQSSWCKEELARPGEWVAYTPGSKDCEVLGESIICDSIEFAYNKAIRSYCNEDKDTETSSDPSSKLFKDIVYAADISPHIKGTFNSYGPVYKVTVKGSEYELYCLTKTMKRFAHACLPCDKPFRLSTREHTCVSGRGMDQR